MTARILIVDDDQDDIAFLIEAFIEIGVQDCRQALTAEDALQYLHSITNEADLPHCIVTDLILPRMNGAALLKELKETNRYKRIAIIILSNQSPNGGTFKYNIDAADGYFNKPYSHPDYLTLTRDILGKIQH